MMKARKLALCPEVARIACTWLGCMANFVPAVKCPCAITAIEVRTMVNSNNNRLILSSHSVLELAIAIVVGALDLSVGTIHTIGG